MKKAPELCALCYRYFWEQSAPPKDNVDCESCTLCGNLIDVDFELDDYEEDEPLFDDF